MGIAKTLVHDGVFSLKVGPEEFVSERPFLITTNYPVALPVALSLKLFGISIAAARIPLICYLGVFCITAYFLVKRIYSEKAARMSAALVITFTPLYANGKTVLGEVPGLALFLVGLWFLKDKYTYKKLFLAGLFFGLSIATKPFFLLLIPAILIGEVYNYKINKDFFWKRFFTLGLGISIPVAIWMITLMPSLSRDGVSKMIGYYANSYAEDTDMVALVLSNTKRFFTESTPVHFLILLIVACTGFVYRVKRKIATEAEVIIMSMILMTGAWYLKTPGWYRYFFPAHVLVFLLVPGALFSLTKKRIMIYALSLLVLVQGCYLLTRPKLSLYNSDSAVRFSEMTEEIMKPADSILVINSPSIAFLLEDREVYQFLQINPELYFGRDSIKNLKGKEYDYIVTSGPLENTALEFAQPLLGSIYKVVGSREKYTLYQRQSDR